MMLSFLQEWAFVLAMLAALGLAGGFALVPFRRVSPFLYLAAPLAGLPLLALGLSGGHSILSLPVPVAGVVVLAGGSVATLASLAVLRPRLRLDWTALAAALVVAAGLTAATNAATIRAESPSLGFVDGSDQFGYAVVADWLLAHSPSPEPVASPDLPYQSWPQHMYQRDPRFGTLHFLAFIAWLRGTSGLFAFDSANAIALSAGTIGLAAIFTASRGSLLLLVAGLATGYWYDYSRSGFFGKIMSYPADIFLLRLLFHQLAGSTTVGLASVTLLAGAVATLHSGISTAAVILPAATIWVAARTLLARLDGQRDWQIDRILSDAAIIALLCFVAVSQSGVFGRPGSSLYLNHTTFPTTWTQTLLAALDLENANPPVSGLPQAWLVAGSVVALTFFGALLVLAIRLRNLSAVALLVGPGCIFLVLAVLGRLYPAYQLIGTYDPAFLCAAALVIDQLQPTKRRMARAAFAAAGLVVLLHQPRFFGALDRFATATPSAHRYSRCETDEIARRIGQSPVRVDLTDPQAILVILGELGRRDADLQWTPRSWDTFLSYRHWPAPSYAEVPKFRLTAATEPPASDAILLRTPHYILSRVAPDGGADAADATLPKHCRALEEARPKPPSVPPSIASNPASAPIMPSAVRRFPDDLMTAGLFFAGVSPQGWLGAAAQTKLALAGGSNLLRLSGEVPAFSAKIAGGTMTVSVDGKTVLETPEKPGPFDLAIPIPLAPGPRRIELRMSGVDTDSDGRTVSIRLTAIALDKNGGP